nr:class I SAM-dependent methyltransferase [Pseudomonas sp.]
MSDDAASCFARAEALAELARLLQKKKYRFVTVSPATHQRVIERPDQPWARDLRDIFGWSKPFRADVAPAGVVPLMQEAGILEAWRDGWRSRVRFSTLNETLYVHSAYPTHAENAVFFGPDTYRFTRAIGQHLAQRTTPINRAVDVGCGAGPGAIVVAQACPDAQVWALDINQAALQATAINAEVAGCANVIARESNLFDSTEGLFDLIVANPPYLNDPSQRAYRHGGGELGAQLSVSILEAGLRRLAPAGSLVLYTGVAIVDGVDPFLEHARALLNNAAARWWYEEIDPDVFGEELETPAYAQTDRIAAVVLTVQAAQ